MRKNTMTFIKWLGVASVIALGVAAPVLAEFDLSSDRDSKVVLIRSGGKICLDGSTCNTSVSGNGTTVSLTGAFSPSGDLTLAANKSLLGTTGTGAVDLSMLTGTFKTPTGAHTIGGTTTIAAGKNLVMAAGAGAVDFGSATGTFSTPTGATTVNGAVTFAANKGIAMTAGTGAMDFSNGTGIFKTTTGAVTIGTGAVTISGELAADLTAAQAIAGGFDFSVATAAQGVAGSTFDLVAGAGGAAATDSDGQAGGALTITGAAGSAKNGAGVNDGSGGDVVLLGGAKGGANGSAVDGIVRVGAPSVNSTKTTNLLAVGGALEVDGAQRLEGDTQINGNFVIGTTCTGNVVTDAVTCNGLSGVITDDGTDINADTSRTAITLTNNKMNSTSVVHIQMCSAPDANSMIVGSVAPGVGTASIVLRNVGTSNYTSAGLKICFWITN